MSQMIFYLRAISLLLVALCVPSLVVAADVVVPTVIIGAFSDDQRARIQDAVAEWNRAMNGHIRLEIRPNTGEPKVWAITAAAHSVVSNKREALAETMALPTGGGLVVVYLDRLGGRYLDGIMLHELGHVLGLQHEGRGLMAAAYNPHDQKCVDYAAAIQIAALYQLPLAELRWCGEPATAR